MSANAQVPEKKKKGKGKGGLWQEACIITHSPAPVIKRKRKEK